MNNQQVPWTNNFERLSIQDIGRHSSQDDRNFQHRIIDQEERKNNNDLDNNFESPFTLRYRDSISSTASSLSRNSTVSSIDTRYYSAATSPSSPLLPRVNMHPTSTVPPYSDIYTQASPVLSPMSMPSPELYQKPYQSFSQPLTTPTNTIDPNGCFVPCKPLPLLQQNEITKYHYVVPTFAMIGQNQADVMQLLFNITDNKPFEVKEELERTLSLTIDQNTSLITLSQYTGAGADTSVKRNYLVGLGQRLGITSILIIVSIEAIHNVYLLLNNLNKAFEIDAKPNNLVQKDQASWWSRVILVVNQQHGISPQAAYSQRKTFLMNEMSRIQEEYNLSQPLSTLFLSTQIHTQLRDTEKADQYKQCCQRILWQMMQKHTLCGRWCSEIISLQSRMNSINNNSVNILTEDDESSSSSDEEGGMPKIINYVDYKVVKKLDKKVKQKQTQLQRRSTRRVVQKVHCYDGDDGTTLPSSVRDL